MPVYNLEGQVALITGGGRGMGRAIALRLAQEGCAITVADLDLGTASTVVEEARARGSRGIAVRADVTCRDDANRIVAETVDAFERLDILVNNAGVLCVTPILELDDDAWDLQMNVNARGVLYCSQAAARQMIEQGHGGRIVTVGSTAGKIPAGVDTPIAGYVASKHAAVGLTKQMALELAKFGILVNCVFPGIVDTDMLSIVHRDIARIEGTTAEEVRAGALESIPLGYFQPPEKVAAMVAFLCSSDSDYSVGSVFDVTGGAFPYY